MINEAKAVIKRHWPALKLRTILLGVLLVVAALPVFSAVGLRVYENTLVRQTEAELVAQGAALSAAAAAHWPGVPPPPPADTKAPDYYRPERTTIDLSDSPILPERPAARRTQVAPDADAVRAAEDLGPIIDATVRTTLASILVLDSRGQVVRGYGRGGDLSRLPEVRAALNGAPATVLRDNSDYRPDSHYEWLSRASTIRIHHARSIIADGRVRGVLLMSRSPRALFRGVYEDRGKIVFGLILILGLLTLLGGLVSRGISRPIVALSRAAREVTAGRGDVPETPSTAAIEIRALYEDFREMAQAIETRSRYLRDFAAAVSHEFKTPLAGIGGAVELLQDHFETMSAAERRRFLDNIAADNARLTQLVTRLLDMARADMARPEAGAAVALLPAARRVADSQPALTVTIDLTDDLPAVAVPEATIEAVLTTLLENSRQAGAKSVVLSAAALDGHLCLVVEDDGPGIAEADRERLFEPFFTSHRADGGTGLGLSIARSLLAASHATIAAMPCAAGARFELRLPLAP
ncbi:MAG: HAMP domain-containing sensor histidine kinase [Caulobacter sp.]|nr:HAMP domain-containing sensor histidine kinase [Caulobacter sp.]